MRYFWIFSLLLVLTLFTSSCGKKEETIKIGLVAVQTGPDGQFGSKMLQGAQIAIDEWNAKGGLLGKKIESLSRDDEAKPNQAVAVAHELVAHGAKAIIGHFTSGCSIPASNVYAEAPVVQITPGSTNPGLTEQGLSTVFRLCGRDDQQGRVAAEFAHKQLKLSKVAVLHNKTAYGQGIAEEFKKTFEALGGHVIIFEGISGEELDFRANINVLKGEKAEGLFWGGLYSQGGPLFNQMRQAGLQIPFLAGDGTFEKEFLNTVGGQAQGVYLTYGPDYQTIAQAQPFLEKYRKQFGEEGPYSIYGYEAANVLFQGIAKAGTTDAKQVASALRSMSFSTSLGTIEFDEKGDLKQASFIVWTIRDGKLAPWKN